MPSHLRPTAAIAPRALLPTDPGVALALAQSLTERPLMANHARGLWGYTGTAPDGAPLTIQSVGIGGPCVALVLAELADLGLREAVLLGEASALPGGPDLGARVHVGRALGLDGTSHALGAEDLTAAPGLAGGATVVSVDVAGDDAPTGGAACADLSTAGLLAAARRAGVRAGALLVVSRDAAGAELADDELAAAMAEAGAAGAALLGAT